MYVVFVTLKLWLSIFQEIDNLVAHKMSRNIADQKFLLYAGFLYVSANTITIFYLPDKFPQGTQLVIPTLSQVT